MHCHLRLTVSSVVLGVNHEAAAPPNFSTIGQCTAELLMIQHIFPPVFQRAFNEPIALRGG